MRFVVATFLFAMGISYGAVADTLPPDIKILLDKESALNDRCRGGSGDDPQTQKYCDQRDETFGQLKSKGWCYGPDEAPGYQKSWRKCQAAGSEVNNSPPKTQAADPYADQYEKDKVEHYKQHRSAFLESIQKLYFAVGCKVLPDEGSILPFVNAKSTLLNYEALNSHLVDDKVSGMMRGAAHTGMDQSSQPGACDYWHQHPDEVFRLRQVVEAVTRSTLR